MPTCSRRPSAWRRTGDFALSYIASIRFDGAMGKRRDWRAWAQALEYWILAALVIGAFMAGLWGVIRG